MESGKTNVNKTSAQLSTVANIQVSASAFSADDITFALPQTALDLSVASTGYAGYLDNGMKVHEYSAEQYAAGHFIDDITVTIDLSDLADSQYAGDYTIDNESTEKVRIAKVGTDHTNKATCVGTSTKMTIEFNVSATGVISLTNSAAVNDATLTTTTNTLTYSFKVSVGPKYEDADQATATNADTANSQGAVKVTVKTVE